MPHVVFIGGEGYGSSYYSKLWSLYDWSNVDLSFVHVKNSEKVDDIKKMILREPTVLMGHSIGAVLAIIIAKNNTAMVTECVLFDPTNRYMFGLFELQVEKRIRTLSNLCAVKKIVTVASIMPRSLVAFTYLTSINNRMFCRRLMGTNATNGNAVNRGVGECYPPNEGRNIWMMTEHKRVSEISSTVENIKSFALRTYAHKFKLNLDLFHSEDRVRFVNVPDPVGVKPCIRHSVWTCNDAVMTGVLRDILAG